MKTRTIVIAVTTVLLGAAGAEPTALFNGKDFEDWKLFIPDENIDPLTVWSVKDGVIHCSGNPAGYMRTTKSFTNYKVSVDWRWPEGGGNNGLLLHIVGEDAVPLPRVRLELRDGDVWATGREA